MSTELAVPHSPVTVMVAGPDPDEPDFEGVCEEHWPCLIAKLSGLDKVAAERAWVAWEEANARYMRWESETFHDGGPCNCPPPF